MIVTLHTHHGDIVLQLNAAQAPITVQNFLSYCREKFYDNTLFHRVISDFMIQGGGFTTGLQTKKTKAPIINEADNGLLNQRGAIAMARTADPHSATAQFFINLKHNDFLNFRAKSGDGWGYCVFGQVVEGLSVIDKIATVQTASQGQHQDVPRSDVVITHVTLHPPAN